MAYVFAAPPQPVVPVAGSTDLFPVHRVYCVGRNYAEHAREMGHSGREAPFFFGKPPDALLPVADGGVADLPYPPMTADLHHEIELVVAIGRRGTSIAVDDALAHVWGYAVGLDMTRRDLQGAAKQLGRPWDTGKGFDHSAPIGPVVPVARCGHPAAGRIWLDVNGQARQRGDLGSMIWSVAETLAELSRYFELAPGDLVFTGTPQGVGPVARGDLLAGGVDGVGTLGLRVV